MAKCVALVGGWMAHGTIVEKGQVIEGSEEWIAKRIADVGARHPNGLVEAISDSDAPKIEKATKKVAAEKAVSARGDE